MRQPIAIVGPTAVGKSWLGAELALAVDGEIINADALQAYCGFDIGTAKPNRAERRRIPHHLIDILEPAEIYSAGAFARQARQVLADIETRGRRAVIVGGSGLYLRALLRGISPIPATDPEVAARLQSELENHGLGKLRQRLLELDPTTAERLHPGDTQRILRALEVVESTGRPLSAWLARDPAGEGAIDALQIGLTLPRTVLYDRIAERVRTMIQAGWVQEVEDLLRRGMSPDLPAFQAIGYRELVAHLRGETSLDAAIEATITATRRYAKRQMTWFRADSTIRWFSMLEAEDCLHAVREFVGS